MKNSNKGRPKTGVVNVPTSFSTDAAQRKHIKKNGGSAYLRKLIAADMNKEASSNEQN